MERLVHQMVASDFHRRIHSSNLIRAGPLPLQLGQSHVSQAWFSEYTPDSASVAQSSQDAHAAILRLRNAKVLQLCDEPRPVAVTALPFLV